MMSEFKGTKGKWEISEQFDERYDQPVFELKTQKYDTVCTIWSWQDLGDVINEECRANAKLIACAPEMLEMLEKIEQDYDCGTDTYARIVQLIKKATK